MTRERTLGRCVTALIVAVASADGPTGWTADYVWWEGESPKQTNFPKRSWFSPRKGGEEAVLSGGNWLTSLSNRFGPPLFAKYDVRVPKTAAYSFWVRKFWRHGEFRWRFDSQEWRKCGRDCVLADSAEVRFQVCANWVPLGSVELTAGEHVLHLETTDAVLKKPEAAVPPKVQETVTEELADWCTVTHPKGVSIGQRIPITVTYSGIKSKTKLCCGLLWKDQKGRQKGFVQFAPKQSVEREGKRTFMLSVANKGTSMGSVFGLIYLSKDGKWESRTGKVATSDMPIDPKSLRPVVQGAGAMCIDCFVLSSGTFAPRGKLKPGEKSGKAMDGYVAFEPDRDRFGDDAMLNLRFLNEDVAGQSGPVTRKAGGFRLGDGKEVKFWATTIHPLNYSKEDLAYQLRRLAKLGINMVRIYQSVFDRTSNDLNDIDRKCVDIFQFIVAEAKKLGIYSSLNIYFTHFLQDMNRFGFKGWKPKQHPWMLHIFDDRMREYTKHWARELMVADNPYGPPLAQEPAVAMVQIQSEDTIFWYSTNPANYPREVWHNQIGGLFGEWLAEKYGSIKKAYAAWGGGQLSGDDPSAGIAVPLPASALRANPGLRGARKERAADMVRFYAQRQRDYYTEVRDVYRGVGYQGVVLATGFQTCDPTFLEDIERWCHTVTDATDRHHYLKVAHLGRRAKYAVDKGDQYWCYSALKHPEGSVLRYKTVVGFPAIVSEFGWQNPCPYQAEAPFLIATYGSLTGIDCFKWFANNCVGYNATVRKFAWNVPELMGQMPGTALIYRRGDVAQGRRIALEVIDPRTMVDFRRRKFYEAVNYDPTRGGIRSGAAGDADALRNALAFFVGRIQTSHDPSDRPMELDVSQYIDEAAKTVRSTTGELELNYGLGLATVNTDRAQGATGSLAEAGRIDLDDVAIVSRNDYGTVLVVSYDGRPLAESSKVLIQAATSSLPYGWQEVAAEFTLSKAKYRGKKIVSLGGYPRNMKKIDAAVILTRGSRPSRICALDTNGYAIEEIQPVRETGGTRIPLREDALYTMVEF